MLLLLRCAVLPLPQLLFKNSEGPEFGTFDGSWNLKEKVFMNSSELHSLAVVDLAHGCSGRNVHEFVHDLIRACDKHGIKISYKCRTLLKQPDELNRLIASSSRHMGVSGNHEVSASFLNSY